jgi:hypothetical protein
VDLTEVERGFAPKDWLLPAPSKHDSWLSGR